ncbi:hypothetical protein AB0I81_14770 [Nonomuraea sp. NPDC050404]|uniref:IS1096 element passenger TnpR family protein n=1 Tax=Nonomuraea sp. NPDC050404 TaxID=3155783 RepID=UPI0033EBCB28
MSRRRSLAPAQVHQLKVTLWDFRPTVWRRLRVPSEITLGVLSDILQDAFEWVGKHPHKFCLDSVEYVPEPLMAGRLSRPGPTRIREDDVRLRQAAPRRGVVLDYVYDLRAEWRHRIEVEDVFAADPETCYPSCTAGHGRAPDEDSDDYTVGAFGEGDRLTLDKVLFANGALLGRDLPLPAGQIDPVFTALFPAFAVREDDAEPPARPGEVAHLVTEAEACLLVRRAHELAAWVGSGRAVTLGKVLQPADALRAVADLGLDCTLLPEVDVLLSGVSSFPGWVLRRAEEEAARREGGRMKNLRNAKDLPVLHDLWSAAVEAGLITVRESEAIATFSPDPSTPKHAAPTPDQTSAASPTTTPPHPVSTGSTTSGSGPASPRDAAAGSGLAGAGSTAVGAYPVGAEDTAYGSDPTEESVETWVRLLAGLLRSRIRVEQGNRSYYAPPAPLEMVYPFTAQIMAGLADRPFPVLLPALVIATATGDVAGLYGLEGGLLHNVRLVMDDWALGGVIERADGTPFPTQGLNHPTHTPPTYGPEHATNATPSPAHGPKHPTNPTPAFTHGPEHPTAATPSSTTHVPNRPAAGASASTDQLNLLVKELAADLGEGSHTAGFLEEAPRASVEAIYGGMVVRVTALGAYGIRRLLAAHGWPMRKPHEKIPSWESGIYDLKTYYALNPHLAPPKRVSRRFRSTNT